MKIVNKSQNSATSDNRLKSVNFISEDSRPGIIDAVKEIKPATLIEFVEYCRGYF